MIWATDTEKYVTKEDRNLMLIIGDLLWNTVKVRGDSRAGRDTIFECHSICRALFLELGKEKINLVSGHFMGVNWLDDGKVAVSRCSHSWLETKNGVIIDPYPVARMSLSPIIVVSSEQYQPFGANQYRADENLRCLEGLCMRKIWRKARILQKLFHQTPA